MSGRLKTALGAGLAAASMIATLASPAAAKSSADSIEAGRTLNVAVTGHLTARCQIEGGADIDFGELNGGERAVALFDLDCNVPFDIGVVSTRGGLAHVTKPQGEGPYAGVLPYDVLLTVPTRAPQPSVLRAAFTSQGGGRASSGDGIAVGGGKIEFRTHRPSGAGLLAGEYTETLTVTVSPRV